LVAGLREGIRVTKKILLICFSIVAAGTGFVYVGNDIARTFENSRPSTCIGTPAKGSLINGKRLPTRGKNFVTCSYLGAAVGRNAVHSLVREVVLDAYQQLQRTHANRSFVYGDAGWPSGGRLWPHITHRNGLSIDFMVPVTSREGKPIPLPCNVLNKWGYSLEFDKSGVSGGMKIDFPALAAHLFYLNDSARRRGIKLRIVILSPELQRFLFTTPHGHVLKNQVRFSRTPAWVRHDDHYHVDFLVPCR
jgi:penicillin-insensitive murein DD-endopeptidase